MSAATAIKARITPPNLSDPRLYVCLPAVAILDVHCRNAVDEQGNPIETYCGPDQLAILCNNSQARIERTKEYGLIRVGHINVKLPNHEERKQPPIIGYIPKYYMGELNDETVILADLYIKKNCVEDIENYPRRSPEIFGKNDPDGFIDALAFLNRPPERDLGLVTYSKFDSSTGSPGERHMIDENDCKMLAQAVVTALQGFFESQAGGGEPATLPGADAAAGAGGAAEPMMSGAGDSLDAPDPESMAAGGPACGAGMGSAAPAAGASTFPGPTSSYVPGEEEKKKPKEMEHMQSNLSMQEFINFKGEFELFKRESAKKDESNRTRIANLEKDLGEKNTALRRANRLANLNGLAREGVLLNVSRELELCMKQDDTEFAQSLDRMRENYARDISGRPFVEVDPVVSEDSSRAMPKNRFTPREVEKKALSLYQKEAGNKDLTVGELTAKFFADDDYRKRFTA